MKIIFDQITLSLYGYKISLICEKYERIVIDTRDFTLQLYAKVFIEALKVVFQG